MILALCFVVWAALLCAIAWLLCASWRLEIECARLRTELAVRDQRIEKLQETLRWTSGLGVSQLQRLVQSRIALGDDRPGSDRPRNS